jgi:hypothetical protein
MRTGPDADIHRRRQVGWIAFLNSRRQPALTSQLFSQQARFTARAPDVARLLRKRLRPEAA